MPTRAELLDTLAASQTQVLAFFHGLSPHDLERPATANGVPGAAPWRAKDHLAHLVQNERNIQHELRRILAGETGETGDVSALTPEAEEQLGLEVAQLNQTTVNAHCDDTLQMLVADYLAARRDTLDLLRQFTDEQLAATVRTPIGDEVAGDLFAGRAGHAVWHITWIEEGWRQGV